MCVCGVCEGEKDYIRGKTLNNNRIYIRDGDGERE